MAAVQIGFWVIALLVVLAVLFDFMNGFHDAANSIATVVSTGVLKPGQAVLFAAFFNFVAIFIFHLSVAATVGKGIVEPGVVDTHVVFGALIVYAFLITVFVFHQKNQLLHDFDAIQQLLDADAALKQADAAAFHAVMAVFINTDANEGAPAFTSSTKRLA